MNLKYYRQLFNLSQEKFAEIIEGNLVYLNQIENCKRNSTIDMLDKISYNLNKYDPNLNMTSALLLTYNESHKTNFSRIDEK
jgi:transcriptional regulator with XRE-family HTH domain